MKKIITFKIILLFAFGLFNGYLIDFDLHSFMGFYELLLSSMGSAVIIFFIFEIIK